MRFRAYLARRRAAGEGSRLHSMKHSAFLRSAAVLSAGGILAKGIGALYRIPLSNLLGGYGMGLYQMAYPLFCLLLTLSSAGIPTAFSRTVARETARGGDAHALLKAALRLFSLLGLFGTALMCLLAPRMSELQGGGLLSCYLMLAPSVFFVSLIAVFRGYFQGKGQMKPTAASTVLEQLVKAGAGLFFAYRFRETPVRAVAFCLLAVSLSELCALCYLACKRNEEPRRRFLSVRRRSGTEILYSALPVMAAAALLPLSQTVDSVLIVRLLHDPRAVTLYGLFAGGALSLISLPATVCSGLAAAAVPAVSRAVSLGKEEEGKTRSLYALLITLLLSLPCAIFLCFCAPFVAKLLYPALSGGDAATLVLLIRLLSVSAVTLAGVDTLAACLAGMGRAKRAAASMLAAVLVKFALQWALVGRFSIGGAAIAANSCYLVAFFLDLFYTVKKKRGKKYDHDRRSGNAKRRRNGACAARAQERGQGARTQYVARRGNFD